jgi:ribosome-associated heat shock protein Hsp15
MGNPQGRPIQVPNPELSQAATSGSSQTLVAVRMDKWLWSVRLYKSRSLAARACAAGKVHVAGQTVKASRSVKVGELITAVVGEITRTVKVTGLLESRVGAKLVGQFLEDLTPPSELEKPREKHFLIPVFHRPKGSGRPTKKERRSMKPFLT